MTIFAPLLEALREARRCLSSASTHHGTAVRDCKKCSEASAAVSGIDRALDAFARRGKMRHDPKLIAEVADRIRVAHGRGPWSTVNLPGKDIADALIILDAIEAHLLGPREAGPARGPCPCGDWAPGGPSRPGHPEGHCREAGPAKARPLEPSGHLLGCPGDPKWLAIHPCLSDCPKRGVVEGGAAGPAKEGGTE